jgi:uncharacterized membrane protein (UPF0127 family)
MAAPAFLAATRTNPPPYALINDRTGQVLASAVEVAGTSESRRRGLLGRSGLDPAAALIIAPCSAIHMFFMRFAIDAVFVDRDGRVRKIVQDLQPWRIAISLGAYAVIELASGAVGHRDVEVDDRLILGAFSTPAKEAHRGPFPADPAAS